MPMVIMSKGDRIGWCRFIDGFPTYGAISVCTACLSGSDGSLDYIRSVFVIVKEIGVSQKKKETHQLGLCHVKSGRKLFDMLETELKKDTVKSKR